MRKALLVIVLIGAAFAGGVAVNGPGLAWAKKQLARRVGLPAAIDGESLARPDDAPGDDDAPAAVAEAAPEPPKAPATTDPAASEVPSAPLPPLKRSPRPPGADPAGRSPGAVAPDPSPATSPVLEPPRDEPATTTASAAPGWGDAPARPRAGGPAEGRGGAP